MEKKYECELISIVIPVYNASPYLKDTIRTIEEQTYSNWEVIFVDDASTDESLQILQKFKAENLKNGRRNRVEILSSTKNKGPAAARNAGIKATKGKYLVFLDADDVWDKNKLKKQLAFQKEKGCAFSFTGYEFADETATRNGTVVHVPEKISYEEALKNTTISTITVMFDREKIPEELLLMPENCQREDTATWWNILKHNYTAYGLDEPLSVYRRHAGSHSANKVKAVIGTWRMYREQEGLSIWKTVYYMVHYIYGAVKRRF